MNWADWIRWAMAHPEEFPAPAPPEVRGMPTDRQVLGLYAHNQRLGEIALAAWARLGIRPSGAEPPVEVVRVERPVAHRARRAAAVLASSSSLSLEEALVVVERFGPNHSPAKAVRLHRRIKEESS